MLTCAHTCSGVSNQEAETSVMAVTDKDFCVAFWTQSHSAGLAGRDGRIMTNEEQCDKICRNCHIRNLKHKEFIRHALLLFKTVMCCVFLCVCLRGTVQLTFSSKLNSFSDTTGEVGLCFIKSLKLLDLCRESYEHTEDFILKP